MSGEQSKPSQVKYKYIFSDDYNPVYATGVYGGVIPTGEIAIHFFLERHGLPVSQTMELNEDGSIGSEASREPEDHAASMVRFVSTGVVLSVGRAKSVYEWLGNKIEQAEQLSSQRKSSSS